jgi:hypothetical protein
LWRRPRPKLGCGVEEREREREKHPNTGTILAASLQSNYRFNQLRKF